jgi:hypothetical protein
MKHRSRRDQLPFHLDRQTQQKTATVRTPSGAGNPRNLSDQKRPRREDVTTIQTARKGTHKESEMDSITRTNIILAAVSATGSQAEYTTPVTGADGTVSAVSDPAAWQAKVQENAIEIALMTSDKSDIVKALDEIEKAKVFTGTIVSVKKEQSSTRGVITLFTGTERTRDGIEPGHEQVRTDRTDTLMGLAMARKARDLQGHKVLLHVLVEEYNGGQGKVRVVKSLRDLGVATDSAA